MHDSIDSRASKENEHYVDQFTFGFDSDDEVNRNNANANSNAAKRKQKLNTGESKIDISELAHSAWKDLFGSELQVIFSTHCLRGRTMYSAHCNGINQNGCDSYTSKWIFPICEVNEVSGMMCFPKLRIARHAFLWHILVKVASPMWRYSWIKSLIDRDGIGSSTILKEQRRRNSLVKVSARDNKFYFDEIGGKGEWCVT
eukprot:scaffold39326_cov50-Attheya_sp.AAC.3